MYTMNTNDVEIIDEGQVISVLNKKTGQSAKARNYNGCVNHKRTFAISYSEKPRGFAVLVYGRTQALSECLRLVGLPSYRTLKSHEARSLDSQIQAASLRAAGTLSALIESAQNHENRDPSKSEGRTAFGR